MGFIYKITSPSGRLYVGQTYDIKKRISSYKSNKRTQFKRSIILWSIKKYGWEAHKLEVIEEVDDTILGEREIFWISELKTLYPLSISGMNLSSGGAGPRYSWKHDTDRVAKAKMRCGINSPTYGRKIGKDERKRISESVSKYNKTHGVKPKKECYEILKKKQNIAVIAYSLNGEFFDEYESITVASEILNISRKCVNDAVNGRQKHAGGFVFKRRTENFPYKIDTSGIDFFIRNKKNVS